MCARIFRCMTHWGKLCATSRVMLFECLRRPVKCGRDCKMSHFRLCNLLILFLFFYHLQSVVMLMFREEKSPDDEIKAWQFWHGRQHSVKQRILDAGKCTWMTFFFTNKTSFVRIKPTDENLEFVSYWLLFLSKARMAGRRFST